VNSSTERTSTKSPLFLVENGEDVFLAGANGFVRAAGVIGGRGNFGGFGGQRTLLFHPLFTAAVDQADVFVAVVFQLPQSVGGEPVVVVTVEQDSGVVGDSGIAQQLFERGFVDQVAANVVLELGLPIPPTAPGMWPWA
jgi:hypothetical protein